MSPHQHVGSQGDRKGLSGGGRVQAAYLPGSVPQEVAAGSKVAVGWDQSKTVFVLFGRPSVPLTCFLTESTTQSGFFFFFFNEKHLSCTYHKYFQVSLPTPGGQTAQPDLKCLFKHEKS